MTSIADKEKSSIVETITIEDQDSESKENINTFFSPPKKKFKQDAIPFTKLPKNDERPKKDQSAEMEVDSDVIIITDKPDKPTADSKNVKSKAKADNSPKVLTVEKTAPKASPVAKEAILFPKLSKEEALKEIEKEVQVTAATPVKVNGTSGGEQVNEEESPSCETPVGKKTPNSAKKVSPLSKEERQKLKEEKEAAKVARAKEIEEKRKKKEEEKLQKQAEKEKRENERKEKERQKEEEKRLKEEERKKKEEKKEEERKAKEEERKAKEEERLKKEEQVRMEKEKKDAEREKKEEERKMKEEQKKQEEEKKQLEDEAMKKKKEKAANQFRNFFTKKKGSPKIKAPVEEVERKRFDAPPALVKPDTFQAPIVRNTNIDRELIDKIFTEEIPDLETYLIAISKKLADNKKIQYITRRKKRRELEELRKLELNKNKTDSRPKTTEQSKPRSTSINCPEEVVVIDDNSNDVDDDEDENDENDDTVCDEKYLYISKLLQFTENTRPPYYGTWRKKTKHITGRRPFQKDTDIFNYDVDSDEEWIDEPGENLSDAADEDEVEEKETEDDQDGFFVPHGYLSDDEGVKDEEQEEDEEGDGDASKATTMSANTNDDDKMKLKVCTFERKFQRIKHHKPICIGISFTQKLHEVNPILKDYMKIVLFKPAIDEKEHHDEDEDMEVGSPDAASKNKGEVHPGIIPMKVPEEAMPLLIKFIHGNVTSLPTMIGKFRQYWNPYAAKSSEESHTQISKRQLEKKIQSIASRTGNREGGKTCYIVRDEIITKYGLPSDLKYGETLPELKIDSIVNTLAAFQSSGADVKDIKPVEAVVDNNGAQPPPVTMEIS